MDKKTKIIGKSSTKKLPSKNPKKAAEHGLEPKLYRPVFRDPPAEHKKLIFSQRMKSEGRYHGELPTIVKERLATLKKIKDPLTSIGLMGPFNYKALRAIQILLTGASSTIYWNDYFTASTAPTPGHSNTVYAKYFNQLPVNTTPEAPQRVGSTSQWPPFDQVNRASTDEFKALGVLLGLNRISYSSKYGGSVRLNFSLLEGVGAEFVTQIESDQVTTNPSTGAISHGLCGVVMECSTIDLDVFVTPPAKAFNSLGTKWKIASSYSSPVVEIKPTVSSVYRWNIGTSSSDKAVFESLTENVQATEIAKLDQFFGDYANIIAKTFNPLAQFATGFVHNENRALLTTDDEVVDAIAISNGNLKLWTRTREWIFDIRCRVKDLWVDTELGGEELEVNMIGYHDFYGEVVEDDENTWHRNLPAQRPFSDRPHITLPWYTIGVWKVDDIYDHDSLGNLIQCEDSDGNPATLPDGQPCYQLRREPFLIGVFTRVVEHGPFSDNYLIPASSPGLWSTLPPGTPVWYGNESAWATREFYVWLRSWDPATGESSCSSGSRLEEMVNSDTVGFVSSIDAAEVILGVNGTGYYGLEFESRLFAM